MPSVVRMAGVAATGANLTGLNASSALTLAFWAKGPLTTGDIIRHASTATATRDGFALGFQSTALNLRIYGATGSGTSYLPIATAPHRAGTWKHYTLTFDNAQNELLAFVNGALLSRTAATQDLTGNAACTTTLAPGVIGTFLGLLFDLQILPDVVVPPSDVRLLMNPSITYPGVKARYFGLDFRSLGASATLRDESGNGNDLTTAGGAVLAQGEEPPWRQVFG